MTTPPRSLACNTFDWAEALPSLAVVQTLSDLGDGGPFDPRHGDGVTLHDYVDPDALDALPGHDQPPAQVALTIDGYRVRVAGDEVCVDPVEQ